MSTNHDIDGAVGKLFNDLFGFSRGTKPRKHPHLNWEACHAFSKRVIVLLCQQRGRHQYRDLFSILHRFESSTHRNLGFAIANVADDDAVHRDRRFHIRFHCFDGQHLVFGFDEREVIFHLRLPRRIRGKRISRRGLALRIKLHQLASDFADRCARLFLGVFPVRSAHFGQRRCLPAGVFAQ